MRAGLGPRDHRRPRRHRVAPTPPQRRDGVSEIRAVPASHRARRTWRTGWKAAASSGTRWPRASRESLDLVALQGFDATLPASTVGRTAAARRDGARDCLPARTCCCSTSRSAVSSAAARLAADGPEAAAATLGITTVFVTHDQQEALALSDRLAVMNAGPHRTDRHAAEAFTSRRRRRSSRTSSAARTCCAATRRRRQRTWLLQRERERCGHARALPDASGRRAGAK